MSDNIKCHICNSDMKKVDTEVLSGWGDYEITVKGISSYECPVCGEKLYTGKDVRMLQQLSKSLSEATEKPEYLNLTEVADLLRVSNQTIYNMIRDNRIKAHKFGREWRFIRSDIESSLMGDSEALKAE